MDQQKFSMAVAAYNDKDFVTAKSLYATLLDDDLDTAERIAALVRLASCHDELREYEPALAALKQVLDLDEASVAAWNNIGIICARLDRLDEAREAFERALAADPANVAILVNLGSVAMKLGDVALAKSCLDLAIELAPAHPIAHANLALTLLLFGRIEEAEEELRLAVLHGFNSADPILDRIERMKAVRSEMLANAADEVTADDGDDTSLENRLEEARALLALLEEARAQRRSGEAAPGAEEGGPSIDAQIEALERHIADLESQFSQ